MQAIIVKLNSNLVVPYDFISFQETKVKSRQFSLNTFFNQTIQRRSYHYMNNFPVVFPRLTLDPAIVTT